MGELIGKGIAKDLQNAYDMAIGMHSGVRDKLIAKAVQQHTASTQQTQRATPCSHHVGHGRSRRGGHETGVPGYRPAGVHSGGDGRVVD